MDHHTGAQKHTHAHTLFARASTFFLLYAIILAGLLTSTSLLGLLPSPSALASVATVLRNSTPALSSLPSFSDQLLQPSGLVVPIPGPSLAVPSLHLEEEGSRDTHILNPFCWNVINSLSTCDHVCRICVLSCTAVRVVKICPLV